MEARLIEGLVRLDGWPTGEIGIGAGVPWPVSLTQLAAATDAQRRAVLARIDASIGDRENDALRLAAHHFLTYAGAVAEIVLAVAAEPETKLKLSGVAEIDWLRTASNDDPPSTLAPHAAHAASLTWGLFRRIARVASWTSPVRLPRALLAPDAVAVTHNGLLREGARRAGAIGFHHADEWLAQIILQAKHASSPAPTLPLVEAVADDAARAIGVDGEIAERARRLLAGRLKALMEQAWNDLTALQRAKLPKAVWSGTGGFWPARAIGVEVMRRGGSVRRFDHGGGHGVLVDPDSARLIELDVSTEFVVATDAQVQMLRNQVNGFSRATIFSGGGDPHYRRSPGPVRKRKSRPRVMYAAMPLLGFRQSWPLRIPDFVYLDWQLRLARALKQLDIDLVLKPHPEGLLRGKRHPLADVGPVETRPLEDVLDDADVVIFDCLASTSFWFSIASRCPIVLLDTGQVQFDPMIAEIVAKRVTIIPVQVDAERRLQFDISRIAQAIHEPPQFDHAPFRAMLAGDEARQ